jgi:hypothetical protein
VAIMAPGSAGVSLGERARESAITTLDKANEPEEHDRYDVVVAQRNTVLAVMTFSSLGADRRCGLPTPYTRTEHYPQRRNFFDLGE